MLSIPSSILSPYDEFKNILSLPNTIHRKVKSESSLEELVVGYNSPVCSRTVMEEELTVHLWTLQGMTTTAVRSAINCYGNGFSLGEGTDDKNYYLIKFTHRAAVLSYSLIPGFSIRGIRKSQSFFSMSSGFCSVGAKLLLDKLSHVIFIKKWFACNYLIHLCRSCRDDITITIIYNSLLNKIWAFRKKYGGTCLLPFRSLF
jgi:hypothetical protein